MSTPVRVVICPTGAITATVEPEDVPRALDKAIAVAREVGDGIVTHTPCQSPDERHAIARRLAELFLREPD